MRAESGPQALEALRGLKLRGDDAAVLVADHRMPGMTGVEFLEQAMDVYPCARRVLLTAYADTEAAIRAINVVDLDHYLLKPWNPPEEKFYPVIDAQLDAWRRTPRRETAELRVVGHRWSARSCQVRDFLARNQVSYTWLLDTAPEGAELARAAGDPELPLVVVDRHHGDIRVESRPGDTRVQVLLPLTEPAAVDAADAEEGAAASG